MAGELLNAKKIVGLKQLRKALKAGTVQKAFLADDADPQIMEPLRADCILSGVPIVQVPTMRQLGSECGISVPSACAAILR